MDSVFSVEGRITGGDVNNAAVVPLLGVTKTVAILSTDAKRQRAAYQCVVSRSFSAVLANNCTSNNSRSLSVILLRSFRPKQAKEKLNKSQRHYGSGNVRAWIIINDLDLIFAHARGASKTILPLQDQNKTRL